MPESERLYRYAVELSQQIPWVSDASGRILTIGTGWSAVTDMIYEDLLGAGWMSLIHPDDAAHYQRAKQESLSTGEFFQCEYRMKRKDGSYRWCRTRAGAQHDETGAVVRWYGTIEDVHDRKQAELAYQSHAHLLEMVAQGHPLGEVLEALCHMAEEQIAGARCSILLFDPDRQVLRHGAAPSLPGTFNDSIDGVRIGPAIGSCGTAAYELREVMTADIASDPLWADWRDVALGHGLRACWSKPVLARSGEVLGTFAFYYDEPRAPAQEERKRIDAVCHLAALAIERRRTDAALRESEEHYRYSVELNPQIPWAADPQGNIISLSSQFRALTGTSSDEALGGGWLQSLHPDDVRPSLDRWMRSVASGEPFDTEYRVRVSDGSYRWIRARAAARRDEHGAIVRWYGTAEDIHDRKLAEERLRWAADHDDMTGLANRRLFRECLRHALARADETGRRVALLILDLDDFKQINDRFGHDAGNDFLRAFGKRLASLLAPGNTAARLGGDEFAVILADVAGEDEVAASAKALQERMQAPIRIGHRQVLDCRLSIGAAISARPTMEIEDLQKQADLALYRSKEAGRGIFKLFHPVMRDEAQKTASALDIARKAVISDWIVPFYQPKAQLASGALGGFEALLRWHHPRRGLQSPTMIAPAFEDTELGTHIGERMRLHIFRNMREWLEDGLEFGRIAINASAAEFREDNYAERVLRDLAQAGIPADRLEVEVTESVFLGRGAASVERALRMLKAAGVTVALDDFGTGYASLTHLKQFPVDVIKIDRSFVRDMEADAGDAAIVKAVLGLGQSLGIQVVAEGVETAAQAELLREYGCDIGQGYLFGRPIPAGDVAAIIASWSQP